MKNYIFIFLILVTAACSTTGDAERNRALIGSWEFLGYEDTTFQNPASEAAGEIVLKFKEIGFEGTTGRNEYLGIYAADLHNLTLSDFGISEIAETEQGEKYLRALKKAYDPADQNFHFTYNVEEKCLGSVTLILA